MLRKNKVLAIVVCAAAFAACELGGTTEWPSYTVEYYGRGGDGDMEDSVYKYNETKELNANAFTRTGYVFLGWAETYDGAVKYADRQRVKNLTKKPGATVELYAVWDAVPIESVMGLANKLAWLQSHAQNNGSYIIEIDTNENIVPHALSYRGNNITITLRGSGANRTVSLSSNGAMFRVYNGVTLILDNNITLQGRSGNNNSLVRVDTGGTLVMNAGSAVTGNTYSDHSYYYDYGDAPYGGGVYLNGGTFTMNGGTISGNTYSYFSYDFSSLSYGGGVYVASGTFTMNNGTISGNTSSASSSATYSSSSSYGGGVCVAGGTFTMNGGTISGNTSSASSSYSYTYSYPYGGGVYVNRGIFNKTGGTIYGYSVSDANSNAVRISGTVVNDRGHAVYAYISSSSGKRKETTAGTGVNLSFNGNNGTFSGTWDY